MGASALRIASHGSALELLTAGLYETALGHSSRATTSRYVHAKPTESSGWYLADQGRSPWTPPHSFNPNPIFLFSTSSLL